MKVTVIGNWGGYPKSNEATSSYLVEVDGKRILLDCGSGALSSLAEYIDIEDLDAVVISHYHYDHFIDVFPLHYATEILTNRGFRTKPLNIYARRDEEYFDLLKYKEVVKTVPIEKNKAIMIGEVKISFHQTIHQVTCLAMKIEYKGKTLVYSADTGWQESFVTFAQNADLLICEACLFKSQKGMNKGHLTSDEAGKIGELAQVEKLLLTHFPHKDQIEPIYKEAKEEYTYGELEMAKRGLVITI